MARVIRMSIVLGLVLATLGVSAAVAAEVQSDAVERAGQPAVPTDAFERAIASQPAPTDAHERGSTVTPSPTPVVEDTGWTVSLVDVLVAAAIAVGLVAAGVLLVGAIRRLPPRGHPPLAHR